MQAPSQFMYVLFKTQVVKENIYCIICFVILWNATVQHNLVYAKGKSFKGVCWNYVEQLIT